MILSGRLNSKILQNSYNFGLSAQFYNFASWCLVHENTPFVDNECKVADRRGNEECCEEICGGAAADMVHIEYHRF